LSGGSQAYLAGGALKQGHAEPVFHAANLARNRTLSEAGALTGTGETARLGHEMKQMQLVKIERSGGQIFIHILH
jgi:hypothetical protein